MTSSGGSIRCDRHSPAMPWLSHIFSKSARASCSSCFTASKYRSSASGIALPRIQGFTEISGTAKTAMRWACQRSASLAARPHASTLDGSGSRNTAMSLITPITELLASSPFGSHRILRACTAKLRTGLPGAHGSKSLDQLPFYDDPIDPSDEIARYFVAIDFVQTFVAAILIEVIGHVFESSGAISLEKLTHIVPDGVPGTAEDVDGKLLRDPRLPQGLGHIDERHEYVDIKPYSRPKAAQGVSEEFVDLDRIAREPVKRGPCRFKRPIEGPEDQTMQERASSMRPDAQALEACEQKCEPCNSERLAIRP